MLVNFKIEGLTLMARIPGTDYVRTWIAKDVMIALDQRNRIIVVNKDEASMVIYSVPYANCIIDGNIDLKLSKTKIDGHVKHPNAD
jgi:hypothetical protein